MTAEQLEELLALTGSADDHLHFGAVEKLKEISPSLAHRVLAAEKLVEALNGVRHYIDGYAGCDEQEALDAALTAYREASK